MSDINSSKKALTGPQYLITLCTHDLYGIKNLLLDGLAMTMEGPFEISESQRAKQNILWEIPDEIEYDIYRFSQDNSNGHLKIRLIHVHDATPEIRQSYNSRELGMMSLNFSTTRTEVLDKHFKKLVALKRGQGEVYKGTNFVQFTNRKNEEISGNLFSTTLVSDRAEEDATFLVKVLGLTKTTDDFFSTTKRALPGIEKNVMYRAIDLNIAEQQEPLIKLIEYEDGYFIEGEAIPRLPNQGFGMISFQTADLGEVLARAYAQQIKVYRSPRKVSDVILGDSIVMTLLSPGGLILEVFNKA